MFCPGCNHQLSGVEKFCPECGTPARRVCTNGHELEPNAKFCPECGAPSQAGSSTPIASSILQSSSSSCFNLHLTEYKPAPPAGSVPQSNLYGVSPTPSPAASLLPSSTSIVTAPRLNQGEKLGEVFVIEKSLGSGAFGDVYLAENTILREKKAIKVVCVRAGQEELASKQLIHEFKIARDLRTRDHVIRTDSPVLCDFKGASLILLPMDYAEGGSLREWIVRNKSSLTNWPSASAEIKAAALEYFRQACQGVAELHTGNLLHLDLKPENLLIQDGAMKVADLGFARNPVLGNAASPVLLSQGVGTPTYMSPEQVRGTRAKDLELAADVYALGVILFELLDGDPPFEGTSEKVKQDHLQMEPPRLKNRPTHLCGVMYKCLEKKPESRYQSIGDLLQDLDDAMRKDQTADRIAGLIETGDLPTAKAELTIATRDGVLPEELERLKHLFSEVEDKQNAEQKRIEEIERLKREEEEAKRRAEEEVKRKAEEEARRKAEEEKQKKDEEQARIQAEQERMKREEQARLDNMAKEKTEKERLEKEKAEQEKRAKEEKAKQERLAQERAETERKKQEEEEKLQKEANLKKLKESWELENFILKNRGEYSSSEINDFYQWAQNKFGKISEAAFRGAISKYKKDYLDKIKLEKLAYDKKNTPTQLNYTGSSKAKELPSAISKVNIDNYIFSATYGYSFKKPVHSPIWSYCAKKDCNCDLPKVCATENCNCKRQKICIKSNCNCNYPKMCDSEKCNCNLPKVVTS